MSGPGDRSNEANPFATRLVRPGALEYLFPPGKTVAALVDRLASAGWRGQIVGPHGSGKSTLLAAVVPAIEETGRRVVLVQLHDGQRRLSEGARWGSLRSTHPTMLVIDGYEQLPWWRRRFIQWRCRRWNLGLLVTSHRSVGLPEIFRTRVDAPLARQIVAKLLTEHPETLSGDEIDDCVGRHDQDLREALFELYDVFQQRLVARRRFD